MTEEELLALERELANQIKHFQAKADEANDRDDAYWSRYYDGKADGIQLVARWLQQGLYTDMVKGVF